MAAIKGGANRIELCEDLSIGGVTPTTELLKHVLDEIRIETHVLIRPRGGDFCYSAEEVLIMIDSIEMAKKAGATGVVFGALTASNQLDVKSLKQMLLAAQGMDCSFHKAFDELKSPETAINPLILLGFKRILTSGGKATALKGLPELIKWNQTYGQRIEIMPGGGIRPENIQDFLGHNFKSIHSAAIPKNELETDMKIVASLKESAS